MLANQATATWIPSAILASLVVSLTSLGGVAILRFHQQRRNPRGGVEPLPSTHKPSATLVDYMTTFAAGCLLGVVVFHLLPESSEKLSEKEEWIAGVLVLAGIFASLLVEIQVHVWLSDKSEHHRQHHPHGCHTHAESQPLPTHTPATSTSTATLSPSVSSSSESISPAFSSSTHRTNDLTIATDDDELCSVDMASTSEPSQIIEPFAWMTAIGDFFHAFTDGVVLAVGFQGCSSSLGWAVAFGIILHEVPHRVGDFFVFMRAGMHVEQAVAVNLLASLGSLVGVIVIASLGTVSDAVLGGMLAVGAGSLLFIALSELLPPMLSIRDQATALVHVFWLMLGCTLIWLSALTEVECEGH